ncbi:hypothetical protein An09g00090 [Aspergillus niger]|uniref:Uncharacterized protein n=2 Tax=Aspergillus niger TaxID=5061 RepID=A2QSY2_ASPNC|nr:hypothetical protein An09g00090 [Aspergillus niger]CAK45843.1 hypothetical protein An09g00090 [Aspergillus niger]
MWGNRVEQQGAGVSSTNKAFVYPGNSILSKAEDVALAFNRCPYTQESTRVPRLGQQMSRTGSKGLTLVTLIDGALGCEVTVREMDKVSDVAKSVRSWLILGAKLLTGVVFSPLIDALRRNRP